MAIELSPELVYGDGSIVAHYHAWYCERLDMYRCLNGMSKVCFMNIACVSAVVSVFTTILFAIGLSISAAVASLDTAFLLLATLLELL